MCYIGFLKRVGFADGKETANVDSLVTEFVHRCWNRVRHSVFVVLVGGDLED